MLLSVSCYAEKWCGCSSEPDPQRAPRSAATPVSLLLRPHSHLGHREKECADLMMYRKSVKPHGDPSPAIGRRWASEKARPTVNQSPWYKKHVETQYVDPLTVCLHWDMFCYALCCSTSPVASAEVEEVLARQDREQKGWNRVRGGLYPLKADGKQSRGHGGAERWGRLP